MTFPQYGQQKPSGVPWIANIPAHWKVVRLRYLAECMDGKRIPLNAEQRAIRRGDIPYWGANSIMDFVDDALFDEDLVLLGEDGAPFFDPTKPVAFFSSGKVWPNNHIHVLRPTSPKSARFIVYALNSVDYADFIDGSTRDKLTQGRMNDIPLPWPSISEQTAVTAFLDRETAKIDALVDEQRRLIELLREKRQAVISRAVTKGLNPDAPMKDSGVEWLGEVPGHWELKRLSHLARASSSITYGIVQAGPDIAGGVPYIRTSDMSGDELPVDGYLRTSAEIDEAYARSRVRKGDLVIAIRATIGKPLIVPHELDGANLTQGTAKFSPADGVLARYVCHFLRSDGATSEFARLGKGATFKEITLEVLRRFPVLLPPFDEQESICDQLDKQLSVFDRLTSDAKSATELLSERRAALIGAAVTGKIDVRETAEVELVMA